MAISPQTNVKLLKVPLEISNKHQLDFANKQAQFNYFNSLEKIEIDEANYQRKDNVLYFPAHIDSIIEYNYLMYQNSNYSNKWFYAYITHMEYENNGTTKIYITTDVFQTWQFDLDFRESFIEREMIDVNDDLPGKNRNPEGLEFGELKVDAVTTEQGLTPYQVLAYSYNLLPTTLSGSTEVSIPTSCVIDKLCSPVTFIACIDAANFSKLNQAINNKGYGDYIVSAFTVPSFALVNALTNARRVGTDYNAYYLSGDSISSYVDTYNLAGVPNNIDGYIPNNNKLRQYPYIYLGFNAPNSSQHIYKFEDFTGSPQFKVTSEINPNPNVLFIPQNYKGDSGDSFGEMSSLAGYPLLSTRSDYFNSWLAQNSSIIELNKAQESYNYQVDVIKTGISGTGNILNKSLHLDATALSDAATLGLDLASLDVNHEFYIKQQMAQVDKQKLIPDNVSMTSTNTTLLNYSDSVALTTLFYRFCIRSNFAKRIDKFFDMYGYLTNDIKEPNLNNRPTWNYVKTIGANIVAEIPQEDLETIKLLFDNGITIWHNPEYFLDYSRNNR